MYRIIVVGAGGFGREVVQYVLADIQTGRISDATLRGVIDDAPSQLALDGIGCEYLGRLSELTPAKEDRLILAIGDPAARRRLATELTRRGAQFRQYVHSSSYIASTARLDAGVVVCPNAVINAGAHCADFVVINVFGSVGHGAQVGAYSVLSPFAALNGDSAIGPECFLGTRATIFPKVAIGARCVVDSHSYVRRATGDGVLISSRGKYIEVPRRVRADSNQVK